MKLVRMLFGFHTNRDSMFFITWPLITMLRLVSIFYVEWSPTRKLYRLNFFHLRNVPGWFLLCLSLSYLTACCSTNSVTCNVQIILSLSFIPLCLLTEGDMQHFFSTVDYIDKKLKKLGHFGVINKTSGTLKAIGYMVLHTVFIIFVIYCGRGKSYSATSFGILFSFFYMAVQRRFILVSFQFFCEEISQRFRHLECCWVHTRRDAAKMEEVRLLYHKIHCAVDHLSKAFGLRLLHMIVDISIQCTRFFIITFMFKVETDHLVFTSFIIYQYYCLHSTVTASENLSIHSRSLIKHLVVPPWYKMAEKERIQVELLWNQIEDCSIEISVCGFIAYNRSLILTWGSGMVTLWVLIIQTAPVISQVIFGFAQVTGNP